MKKTRPTRTKSKPAVSKKASKDTETPEEQAKRVALKMLRPESHAAILACTAFEGATGETGPVFDEKTLRDGLAKIADAVTNGDMSHPERLALSQAVSLDFLFTRLAATAFAREKSPDFDKLMRLAFRAQSQCARTLETLATLKSPAIFTKQLNVANQQVVNNAALPPVQAASPPAALPEAVPIVCLANSEIPTHTHERMD